MNPSNTNNIINPKPCNYSCGTRIYWNTSENAFFEVFSGNKHQCPNRSSINKKSLTTETNSVITNKPKYYSNYNKFSNKQQPKPKMSNSLELLQGPIADVQQKYEILSDKVSEANGHVFGSQSHISHNNNELSIVVYFEVPQGKLNEFKQRFHNNTKLILQQQHQNHIHR
jgi:hypothetical protein